jgi:hypothetical protein
MLVEVSGTVKVAVKVIVFATVEPELTFARVGKVFEKGWSRRDASNRFLFLMMDRLVMMGSMRMNVRLDWRSSIGRCACTRSVCSRWSRMSLHGARLKYRWEM